MSDFHQNAARVAEQSRLAAERLAAAPTLHQDEALSLLVQVARLKPTDETLDIACGRGPVVAAFARVAHRAVGLDPRKGLRTQARRLARDKGLANVEFVGGDVDALQFADRSFDVVSSMFAFHHLRRPLHAFAEMVRVCRIGGRIVLCDCFAPDDPAQAMAFRAMERHRDPSTVEVLRLRNLLLLFEITGLPEPDQAFFRAPVEREALIAASFPADGDREKLRQMINDSVERDRLGMDARRAGDTVLLSYPSVVLSSQLPDDGSMQPPWLRGRRGRG
jgi:ubiquinone/menaquinone biosynthesis C-methylase UbiE